MKNFLKIFGVLVAGLAASMFIACNGPQANQAAPHPQRPGGGFLSHNHFPGHLEKNCFRREWNLRDRQG